MKNSKIRSKLSRIDPGFAERTGVLRSLRNQFPEIIEKMIELLIAANKDCENHLHEFAFELNGIAHLYGRRLNSPIVNYIHPQIKTHPDYTANQLERQEKLEKAALYLTGLTWDLCQLDIYHLQNFFLSYSTHTRREYDGLMEVIEEIDLAARIIAACQEAYSSIFKVPVKKERSSTNPVCRCYARANKSLGEIYRRKSAYLQDAPAQSNNPRRRIYPTWNLPY
jgi:hypothetical protein